ncbi:DUF6236 family protein [Amycolatopsis sp. NPDC021455]|uniref:DUF6236 family protein n=1 Tax=Amycolatopsis sp. NPDC021455 TaxID=3154901 RepID=UPI0033C0D0F7
MERPGLYFPYVHVRDENWLKAVALYWPSVSRLVPDGYVKRDSPTARALAGAGFLRDHEPGALVPAAFDDLLVTMRRNADALESGFSLERAELDWDGHTFRDCLPAGESSALGWIHCTKFPPGAVDYLAGRGLARVGRDGELDRHCGRPQEWIGLHPALAGAYMTALATQVSGSTYWEPLTDQHDLRAATPNDDVQCAVRLLLGSDSAAAREAAAVEAYVMLAFQYVRPEHLEDVPVDTILRCREDLAEELLAFRRHVAAHRKELVELASVPVADRRLELFAEHVRQTVEVPLRQLEKGMKLLKLDPTRSLVMTSSVAPPLALNAVLGAGSAVGNAVGAVAAVGNAWWQVHGLRAKAKAASPVGYLLDVRDRLEPKTLAKRVRKVFAGTYGRA